MGKATGFLEFSREQNPSIEPLERISNFNEFHPMISLEERETQGARCMNCGVPFCNAGTNYGSPAVSGCPLHNLIPEWNDEVYKGNWSHAKDRLLKTSNFPEFTGRVCPALCEAACTCGLYDNPVTVRENELAIIETAFERGFMTPTVPAVRTDKRIAVVGSGPAGLATADTLNKRGHNVTVFERENRLGGLLMYGIPNMKLEKGVINRRIELMKAEGVEFVTGADIGKSVPANKLLEEFDAVVLACGAKKARSLKLGEEKIGNVFLAVDYLTNTTKDLLDGKDLKNRLKNKNVVIVGGGDTGNDCVGTSIREGCKSVIQLEMMPKPPVNRAGNNQWPEWPRVLKTDYGQTEAITVFGSDPRIFETTVKELIKDKDGDITKIVTLNLNTKEERELPCDLLLIAAGFVGCEEYTAKAFGTELTNRGVVMADNYMTSIDKVFTAGDMHRGQSLVVWAIREGRECAREVDKYLMGYSTFI